MHREFSRLGIIVAIVLGIAANQRIARAVDPAFTNQTTAAGLSGAVHNNSGTTNPSYDGGCTIGDFDGDGWQDLFWCGGGDAGSVDRLYMNNGDGTLTNEAAAWGVAAAHRGTGAAVGDYDDDGDLDLYVVSRGPAAGQIPGRHKLYRNNGDGTFTDVALAAGVNATNSTTPDGWSANFHDYDLDGDLDLFVTGFTSSNLGSRLFRNNGNGTFTDVTSVSGPGGGSLWQGVAGNIFGFTPLLVDMDGDFYPDLAYIGDFGSSRYFKNNADGTFTHWTSQSNTAEEENGMGGNVGDINNDGKMDYYATSIMFAPNGWTGNKLYHNSSTGPGVHNFHEASSFAGVFQGGYGWGTVLIDFNHDTRVDIAATAQEGGGVPSQGSYLFMNDGDNTFTDMATASGFVHNLSGKALVRFDYDHDGDQDIVIASNNQALRLYRNDLPVGTETHWLRVFLDTSDDPDLAPHGIGARVKATIGALTMTAVIHAGGFQGTSELSAHFGLGAADVVDTLEVLWPNGAITTLTDVAADQTLTISSSAVVPCNLLGDMNVDGFVNGADEAGFVRAKLGLPAAPGENQGCADYGTGTLEGDVAAFVSDLIQ